MTIIAVETFWAALSWVPPPREDVSRALLHQKEDIFRSSHGKHRNVYYSALILKLWGMRHSGLVTLVAINYLYTQDLRFQPDFSSVRSAVNEAWEGSSIFNTTHTTWGHDNFWHSLSTTHICAAIELHRMLFVSKIKSFLEILIR